MLNQDGTPHFHCVQSGLPQETALTQLLPALVGLTIKVRRHRTGFVEQVANHHPGQRAVQAQAAKQQAGTGAQCAQHQQVGQVARCFVAGGDFPGAGVGAVVGTDLGQRLLVGKAQFLHACGKKLVCLLDGQHLVWRNAAQRLLDGLFGFVFQLQGVCHGRYRQAAQRPTQCRTQPRRYGTDDLLPFHDACLSMSGSPAGPPVSV